MPAKRRVIQFSTGNVGVHALRALIGRPDVELVGVHANGAAKIGRDAAELCGLAEPTGVTATDDIDALLALHADCVVYTSQAETRPRDAIEELSAFLAAGVNVVGTSLVWLVAPQHADAWLREPLERACRTGDATLYVNGIDPGFSGDTLVHAALSLSTRATAVTVQEVFDYGSYDDAEFTGVSFGFGTTPDHTPIMFSPGVLTSLWGGQVRTLAEGLGVELDDVRERHEKWVTPQPIDCTMMTVEPGRVAAVRFGVEGVADGRVVITMEHVNRLTQAAAPDWIYPPEGRPGVHRVVVHGDPGVEINAHVGIGIDHNQGGVIATAARAVNAVGAVCDAPAGILAAHDLRPADHLRGTMW
ncbi:dihydrodipicolinate reductase [Mycobacterium sp. NPDC050041]|uniref:NAD(P)H-dependent amine dehydrogenase family protein n=1 Tax=Mycobacterium sp. NPDC050041 TaxID=3364293 RepID=UPI003C2B0D0C